MRGLEQQSSLIRLLFYWSACTKAGLMFVCLGAGSVFLFDFGAVLTVWYFFICFSFFLFLFLVLF